MQRRAPASAPVRSAVCWSKARQTLDPLASGSTLIANIVTALVITGVLLTAGGVTYRWYASRNAKRLADALDLPEGIAA